MSGFERRDGTMFCEGASLVDVVARFGTPVYAYSRGTLLEAYAEYDRAFAEVPHRICYGLKANSAAALLRILAAAGAGAEVVSGGELLAALRAGFPGERIVFSGVGKSEAEIALAIEHDVAQLNAESEDEIARIGAAARLRGRRARVALRVNPDIDPGSHPYISTGLRENKFGVDITLAVDMLRRARELSSVEIVGLQCHIGSQVADLDALEESARGLAGLSRELLDQGFPLGTIDIGGGLAVDYEGGAGPGPRELAARVLPHLRALPLTVLVEPGRSLVARAGVLVTRVLYLKENRGRRFVIVDAGMNDLLRPALYGAYHRIEPVTSRGRPSRRVDVVGPVCETADFLARERPLETVEVGELLVVRDAGAYGFSMASSYNLRPRPAEVLVDGVTPRLIRRREEFEDLVRAEMPE